MNLFMFWQRSRGLKALGMGTRSVGTRWGAILGALLGLVPAAGRAAERLQPQSRQAVGFAVSEPVRELPPARPGTSRSFRLREEREEEDNERIRFPRPGVR